MVEPFLGQIRTLRLPSTIYIKIPPDIIICLTTTSVVSATAIYKLKKQHEQIQIQYSNYTSCVLLCVNVSTVPGWTGKEKLRLTSQVSIREVWTMICTSSLQHPTSPERTVSRSRHKGVSGVFSWYSVCMHTYTVLLFLLQRVRSPSWWAKQYTLTLMESYSNPLVRTLTLYLHIYTLHFSECLVLPPLYNTQIRPFTFWYTQTQTTIHHVSIPPSDMYTQTHTHYNIKLSGLQWSLAKFVFSKVIK